MRAGQVHVTCFIIKVKIDCMKMRLIAATLILVTAVAGCMTSNRIDSEVALVSPGEHRTVLTARGFKTTRPIRVKYADLWQTEEYALFKDDGRQCEIIYAEASKTFTVALDYQMPIKEMVATWNLNSGQNIDWGPLGRLDSRFGTWFYRTYEHSDRKRPCVGFMVEWDQIYEDPGGRPGKVLFGYFCGAVGETLEDQAVHALIRGFSVRMPGESIGAEKSQSIHNIGSGKTAIAAARGHGPSAGSGNPGFPFMFARYYSMNNGGKLK
jgi:hypothetical protein